MQWRCVALLFVLGPTLTVQTNLLQILFKSRAPRKHTGRARRLSVQPSTRTGRESGATRPVASKIPGRVQISRHRVAQTLEGRGIVTGFFVNHRARQTAHTCARIRRRAKEQTLQVNGTRNALVKVNTPNAMVTVWNHVDRIHIGRVLQRIPAQIQAITGRLRGRAARTWYVARKRFTLAFRQRHALEQASSGIPSTLPTTVTSLLTRPRTTAAEVPWRW